MANNARRRFTSALSWLLLCAAPAAAQDGNLEASKLLRAGFHEPALTRVNTVLASKPDDREARFLKGLILSRQGKTAEALTTFRQLADAYPDLAEAHQQMAMIYAAQGDSKKARAALEQSMRSYPPAAR
jgi:Flp pilus assembly protein TadD